MSETWYLIWSLKHGQWWRTGGCGYCDDAAQAGRYNAAEAGDIVVNTGIPNENVAVHDSAGTISYWLRKMGQGAPNF